MKELNAKQEQLLFEIILINRIKLNFDAFEASFEELAGTPPSAKHGASSKWIAFQGAFMSPQAILLKSLKFFN